jgi:hypothetical protein
MFDITSENGILLFVFFTSRWPEVCVYHANWSNKISCYFGLQHLQSKYDSDTQVKCKWPNPWSSWLEAKFSHVCFYDNHCSKIDVFCKIISMTTIVVPKLMYFVRLSRLHVKHGSTLCALIHLCSFFTTIKFKLKWKRIVNLIVMSTYYFETILSLGWMKSCGSCTDLLYPRLRAVLSMSHRLHAQWTKM